jgi:hypothetical protein
MEIRNRVQVVQRLIGEPLRRWSSFQVRRRTAQQVVALIAAPLMLSGGAVVAQAPVTPVAASWCITNGFNLEYHDKRAFFVRAIGYDSGGNSQTVYISTPTADTKDSNHCWADNSTVYFRWFDYNWNYISDTSKKLPYRCGGVFPFIWCYTAWSSISQVYGP